MQIREHVYSKKYTYLPIYFCDSNTVERVLLIVGAVFQYIQECYKSDWVVRKYAGY